MREQVDRNDFKIKQLEPLHARGNVVSCLLDAGCIEYRKEAGFIAYFV